MGGRRTHDNEEGFAVVEEGKEKVERPGRTGRGDGREGEKKSGGNEEEGAVKDMDEERHGSEAKRQKKDGGRTRRAAGNQGKRQVEEGRAAEDSRRMELWKQKQKPVSLAQGCLPRGEYPAPKRRQQLEPRLPGLSVSTCLPLPPIPRLRLLLLPCSPPLSHFPPPPPPPPPSDSFSSLSPHESALVQGGPFTVGYHLYPRHTDTQSRFTQIHRERLR